MNTANFVKALFEYWSSFGIPAYAENSVPDDAELPYITFDVRQPNWRDFTNYTIRIWYKESSLLNITNKVSQISEDIGEGKRIPFDGGYIFLYKDDIFFQMQPVEDEYLKVAYLTLIIHVLA